MQRRLHSFLGTILCQMTILSNFYFIFGFEVANVYVEKTVFSWPVGTPVLLFFLYCGVQTSSEIKNWEFRRQLTLSKKKN
jgi:hypothetical protein